MVSLTPLNFLIIAVILLLVAVLVQKSKINEHTKLWAHIIVIIVLAIIGLKLLGVF